MMVAQALIALAVSLPGSLARMKIERPVRFGSGRGAVNNGVIRDHFMRDRH